MEQEPIQNTPAGEPVEKTEASQQENINNPLPKNFLIPLSAVVLIAAVALAIYFIAQTGQSGYTQENVSVVRAELDELEGENRIPAGFPLDTPVEAENITEALSMHYADAGVVLHSVSYTSSDTPIEAYAKWLEYMENANYDIPTEGRNIDELMLHGLINIGELNVAISTSEDGTLIQTSYLDKQ